MAGKKVAAKSAEKNTKGFSTEERAAMKDSILGRKVAWGKDPAGDERAVLSKIAQMPEPDRSLGRRIHEIVKVTAPGLSPRLWYGMPAYSKNGDVLCFFQPAHKFKARYGTLGFSDEAKLDEGAMWPTVYAIMKLTTVEEAKISALVKKAVG